MSKFITDCQVEYLTLRNTPESIPVSHLGQKWARQTITALVTFSLSMWNDRCSTIHGRDTQPSSLEDIAHVHRSIRLLYVDHVRRQDPFMADHFRTPLKSVLRMSLRQMKHWLIRVETSRIRQRLRREAFAKIATLQAERHFVNVDRVLELPNRDLSRWIKNKFVPEPQTQTVLEQFFERQERQEPTQAE